MDELEALRHRRSVRAFEDRAIRTDVQNALRAEVTARNEAAGLHIQLILNEPRAFGTFLARYGKFANVRNYLALVGPASPTLADACGYHGEKLVLLAESLGLSSCWVAGTFSRRRCPAEVGPGEKLAVVVALGYGAAPGARRSTRAVEQLGVLPAGMGWDDAPAWFRRGMEAAALAPTAMNQQNFRVTLVDDAHARIAPTVGPYAAMDAGIARYNFEVGAGRESFSWA